MRLDKFIALAVAMFLAVLASAGAARATGEDIRTIKVFQVVHREDAAWWWYHAVSGEEFTIPVQDNQAATGVVFLRNYEASTPGVNLRWTSGGFSPPVVNSVEVDKGLPNGTYRVVATVQVTGQENKTLETLRLDYAVVLTGAPLGLPCPTLENIRGKVGQPVNWVSGESCTAEIHGLPEDTPLVCPPLGFICTISQEQSRAIMQGPMQTTGNGILVRWSDNTGDIPVCRVFQHEMQASGPPAGLYSPIVGFVWQDNCQPFPK